jgi:zinc transport system ATP-binding protein
MDNDFVIKVSELTIKLGYHTVLNNINFSAESDNFIAIVGPNGGGKTTLLKALLGLIQLEKGTIEILKQDPRKLQPSVIGYVPQIKTLDRTFPAIAIELVATGILGKWTTYINKKIRIEAESALDRVGALHIARRQLNKLSGGELQRVYLARSIIRKPKVLLLDEPATGIDISGEKDFNNLIDDYRHETGAVVMMVTHDWDSAFHHADKILILNREQIAFDRPEKAFRENYLRRAFGHIGHQHEMIFGEQHD